MAKKLKALSPRKTAGTKLDPRRDPAQIGPTEAQFTGDQFDEVEQLDQIERPDDEPIPLSEADDTGSPG